MKLAEYFNQDEVYFSESARQLVQISEMPFQQAFFSHRKLLRDFGEKYQGTHLYQAFIRKLMPSAKEIRDQLERYGKACHLIREPGPWAWKTNGTRVRSKLYHAAKYGGAKVATHKVDTTAGSYIEATILVRGISVKGEQIASGSHL